MKLIYCLWKKRIVSEYYGSGAYTNHLVLKGFNCDKHYNFYFIISCITVVTSSNKVLQTEANFKVSNLHILPHL